MRTVEEHQAVVTALLRPLGEESVPLAAAHGRVLARDVTAEVALPGFDNSAMDGYAARRAEVAGAARRRCGCPSPRTSSPAARRRPLAPGTVHRIMTGAPLPPGADVVVPVELTDGRTDVVEIRDSPPAGSHCAPPARTSRPAPSRCRPARRSAPRSWGWPPPWASPRCRSAAVLRVLLLSTGSELVEPGRPLRPGQIYESNSVAGRRRRGRRQARRRTSSRRRGPVPRHGAGRGGGRGPLITSGGAPAPAPTRW